MYEEMRALLDWLKNVFITYIHLRNSTTIHVKLSMPLWSRMSLATALSSSYSQIFYKSFLLPIISLISYAWSIKLAFWTRSFVARKMKLSSLVLCVTVSVGLQTTAFVCLVLKSPKVRGASKTPFIFPSSINWPASSITYFSLFTVCTSFSQTTSSSFLF